MPKTEVVSLRIPTEDYIRLRDARARIQALLLRPVTLADVQRLVVERGLDSLLSELSEEEAKA